MEEFIKCVGMDVHQETIAVSVTPRARDKFWKTANELAKLQRPRGIQCRVCATRA